MVYNEKMVVIIKVNGKVLREQGDTVYIPFGSEYSIVLKNLNSVKAVANVEVDGDDALNDYQLIVPANDCVVLEGFMRGRCVSHKFKFIEKTKQISKFRGDKPCDGLVRVSYTFEKKRDTFYPQIYRDPCQPLWYSSKTTYHDTSGPTCGSSGPVYGANLNNITTSCNTNSSSFKAKSIVNDSGITVKGSSSNQAFTIGSVGCLENQTHVIVLQLKGKIKKKIIKKAVTVKTKVQCCTCGKRSKSKNKFCPNCGTSLI